MAGFLKEVPAAGEGGEDQVSRGHREGLDNAPEAFIGLLKGKNFGKLMVQVSDDPTRR